MRSVLLALLVQKYKYSLQHADADATGERERLQSEAAALEESRDRALKDIDELQVSLEN